MEHKKTRNKNSIDKKLNWLFCKAVLRPERLWRASASGTEVVRRLMVWAAWFTASEVLVMLFSPVIILWMIYDLILEILNWRHHRHVCRSYRCTCFLGGWVGLK